MAIHIGTLIKKRLEETGMTKSEFARRINRSSQNVYDIFERKSLDTALLFSVCEILNYDFFQHYALEYERKKRGVKVEMKNETISLSGLQQELSQTIEKLTKCESQCELLKKENSFLKEINDLLKGKVKRGK